MSAGFLRMKFKFRKVFNYMNDTEYNTSKVLKMQHIVLTAELSE